MTDKEFLLWLHDRLEQVHEEHPLFDYMHRLKAIASTIPDDQKTDFLTHLHLGEDHEY